MTDAGGAQPCPSRPAEERITELEAFAFRAGSDLADIRNTLAQVLEILQSHTGMLQKHSEILETHTGMLQKHSEILESHSEMLQKHSEILESHTSRFDRLDTELGLTQDEVRKNTASLEDIRGRVADRERAR